MKKIYFIIVSCILIAACKSETKNTMTVSGTIKGLKKGTLYLQKIQDSTLKTLDSLKIDGDGSFKFAYEVESPEPFYLYLNKADNNAINDRITFFGEPGEITINTAWNTFDTKSDILGSKSHEVYSEFQQMLSKFNTRELELVQSSIKANTDADTIAYDSIQKVISKNTIRRYQYVINFGLTYPNSHVTPYVTLTEVSDANPTYLDSIYKSLSKEVAASKYGKLLAKHIEK